MKRSYAPYVYDIAEALSNKFHDFHHFNKKNPLDELLFILCSVKRSEKVYLRAYRSLKQAFPKFQDLSDASISRLVSEVSWGGLQNQKAASVRALMEAVIGRFNRPTLTPLKYKNDEECEKFLLSLPGVGKKVARCVMLFSLNRKVFPVDTHCWRIARRLRWIKPSGANGNCTSKDMDRLQEKIPPELRFSLHINMVSLGREICSARNPECRECEIAPFCRKIDVKEVCLDSNKVRVTVSLISSKQLSRNPILL
jgi:endonuclease III